MLVDSNGLNERNCRNDEMQLNFLIECEWVSMNRSAHQRSAHQIWCDLPFMRCIYDNSNPIYKHKFLIAPDFIFLFYPFYLWFSCQHHSWTQLTLSLISFNTLSFNRFRSIQNLGFMSWLVLRICYYFQCLSRSKKR
jgi:hypothetical protein